jgi:hypothetical protein
VVTDATAFEDVGGIGQTKRDVRELLDQQDPHSGACDSPEHGHELGLRYCRHRRKRP